MNHKISIPLWLPLVFLVPNLFSQSGQSSPRLVEPISAVELVTSSSLVPANEEASVQFDETFSKPIQINDGLKRSYVLAVDELYQPTPDGVGQIVPIKESSKPSTLASVANILAKEKNQETRLILYPVGAPHNDQTREFVSRTIVIKTYDREKCLQDALLAGFQLESMPSYAPSHIVLKADNAAQLLTASTKMMALGYSANIELCPKYSSASLPDDPLFANEWHIRGRGQNGAKKASDAKITPVWDQRDSSGNLIRGTGITIGIVDDGVQIDHPDLAANISKTYRYSWVGNNVNDPSPGSTDNHGTCVSGVAAAVGFNGLGVTGVAPSATIAPLRFLGTTDSDALMEAFSYGGANIRVKNNSWVKGTVSPTPLSSAERESLATSANASVITLFCSGNAQNVVSLIPTNGRPTSDNVNLHEIQNSIYTLPIAAVNDQAKQCTYSTPGASIIISAPSGKDGVRPQGTSTTDRTANNGYNTLTTTSDYTDRDYTENFNGTSSATPVVSGVTALVLQANSSLNWRDVKEIYIRSAMKNDSSDSDWARNGAGFWFNHKYGAGLINASDAVMLAKNWSNLGTMTYVSVPLSSLPATIRDNNASGLVKYFDTRSLSGLRVEHATVTTDITHPDRGELQIQLSSPSGTTSRLAELHEPGALLSSSGPLIPYTGADRSNYKNWTFSTVHNWGEDSRGLWKLKIADRVSGNTGTLNSATLTLSGTAK